jgi:hypothetical protein
MDFSFVPLFEQVQVFAGPGVVPVVAGLPSSTFIPLETESSVPFPLGCGVVPFAPLPPTIDVRKKLEVRYTRQRLDPIKVKDKPTLGGSDLRSCSFGVRP